MKKSIIRRAIAAFIAAAMLAGCAAQDSGVLSSVGSNSATESNVSYVEDTSSVDENSEVTSVDSSVTESDTSSDTSEQEENNTSKLMGVCGTNGGTEHCGCVLFVCCIRLLWHETFEIPYST